MQLNKLAVDIYPARIEQRLDRTEVFGGAPITGFAWKRLTGYVGRDCIDGEPPCGNILQCGDLPRQLRGHHFARANRKQQLDSLGDNACRRRKCCCINTKLETRWQQYVVEAVFFGTQHNVAAVQPRACKLWVGYTKKLIIVIAQRRKPGQFDRLATLINQ